MQYIGYFWENVEFVGDQSPIPPGIMALIHVIEGIYQENAICFFFFEKLSN